jgi:hypothetical protein
MSPSAVGVLRLRIPAGTVDRGGKILSVVSLFAVSAVLVAGACSPLAAPARSQLPAAEQIKPAAPEQTWNVIEWDVRS